MFENSRSGAETGIAFQICFPPVKQFKGSKMWGERKVVAGGTRRFQFPSAVFLLCQPIEPSLDLSIFSSSSHFQESAGTCVQHSCKGVCEPAGSGEAQGQHRSG